MSTSQKKDLFTKSMQRLDDYLHYLEKNNTKDFEILHQSIAMCKTLENHLQFVRDFDIRLVYRDDTTYFNNSKDILNIVFDLGLYIIYKETGFMFEGYETREPLFVNDSNNVLLRNIDEYDYYKTSLLLSSLAQIRYSHFPEYPYSIELSDLAVKLKKIAKEKNYKEITNDTLIELFFSIMKRNKEWSNKESIEMQNQLYSYTIAAQKNNVPLSDFFLAICYEYGFGIEKSFDTALKYYQRINYKEECSFKRLYLYLALAFFRNHEYNRGFECLEIGVKKNDIACMYHLAELKYDGIITIQDTTITKTLMNTIIKINPVNCEDECYYQKAKYFLEELEPISSQLIKLDNEQFEQSPAKSHNFIQNKYSLYFDNEFNFIESSNTQKQLNYINHYNNLTTIFKSNLNKMQESSKLLISDSLYLFEQSKNNLKLEDLSPLVLGLFKAIEIELGINIYYNYLNYLKKNQDNFSADQISKNCLFTQFDSRKTGGKPKIKNGKQDFTLGFVKYVVFLNGEIDTHHFEENAYCSYLRNEYTASQYSNDISFLYQHFKKIISEVSNLMKFRNPHLHTDIMDRAVANKCYDLIINVQNIINLVLEIKK